MNAAGVRAVPSRLAMMLSATSSDVPRRLLLLLSPEPAATSRQLARSDVDPRRSASAVSQVRTFAAAGFSAGVMRASSAQMGAFAASDNVYYVNF